jgi:RNA polymerase sigma-70 factor (ECF subfamily)
MRVDEVAIREFLHTSYPRLVAAVALTSGSRPAAEDAVQEALIRAGEGSDRGEEIDSLEGWVTTVALNLARSGLRRLRSERRARARLASAWLGEPPTADRLDVDRALSTLPRRQREAIVLRYYLQLDTREVAAALRVNEGTVKSTLFRARATLAEALGIHDTEEANDRGSG